jgi:hypothetical protein
MPIRLIQHEESFEVRYPDGKESVYFYYDENAGRRAVSGRMTKAQAMQAAQTFARGERDKSVEVEIITKKYEQFHERKPAGRKFWAFTLEADTITIKDHYLNLDDKQRTYPEALEEAKRVAWLRKSVRIIVEP